jgi:hypothetical protein
MLMQLILARPLLWHCEENKALGHNQLGSRPGRSCQDCHLVSILLPETAKRARIPMALFNNDAKSCYDRMVPNLCNTINRSFGLSKAVCTLYGKSLHATKFYIKTPAGTSCLYYQHSDTGRKVFRTWQGSKWLPIQWGLVSCVIMEIQDAEAHGVRFFSPDMRRRIEKCIQAFVDDSNLFTCGLNTTTLVNLIERVQADAQLWSDLLLATGGQLELPKCFYSVLFWEHLPNGDIRQLTKAEIPVSLVVECKGASCTIKQVDAKDAIQKYLGLMQTLDGNQQEEVKRLTE